MPPALRLSFLLIDLVDYSNQIPVIFNALTMAEENKWRSEGPSGEEEEEEDDVDDAVCR